VLFAEDSYYFSLSNDQEAPIIGRNGRRRSCRSSDWQRVRNVQSWLCRRWRTTCCIPVNRRPT